MKHLFLLSLLVFSLGTNAQKFKRFDNTKCTLLHKCNVKRAFNGTSSVASTYKSGDIGLSEPTFVGDKPLEVAIMKVVDADKNNMMVLMFTGKIKDCSDQTSSVSLLLKSGDRVTLPCISKSADCHSNYIMTGVNEADVKMLASNKIVRARLQYINKVEDFDIDKIGQQDFIENFQCLSAIEKK